MSQCFIDFLVGNTFLCYAVVAITCVGCAVADLVGRFKSGNRLSSILIGVPQSFFYSLNIGAGLFALFGSEALESTTIIATALSNLPKAIVEASGLALATFISLRTTVSTLISSGNGQKLEIGPGRLFAVLLENIERRIDQKRTVDASKDIKSIVNSLTPRAVLNVVLPYCFDQAEKDPGDREKITAALEAIFNSDRDIFQNERSALMLSHLHKVFGLSVLKSAIELVTDENVEDTNKTATSSDTVGNMDSDELELSDKELDDLHQQLRAKSIQE